MAAHGEVVLRQEFCRGIECHAIFFICSHCYHGQRYCSDACRDQTRRRQLRQANRRHQRTTEGRLDHQDHQREYRRRQAQARVTDQGSPSILFSASSSSGPVEATPVAISYRSNTVVSPQPAKRGPVVLLVCRICGRVGRFINPFPPVPRRR